MICHETNDWQQRDDGTIQRTYVVQDVEDDAQAIALAIGTAPADLRPTPQAFPTHIRNPNPTVRQTGHAIYEVVFSYTQLVAGDLSGSPDEQTIFRDGLLTFNATAESAHITQAITQRAYAPINCKQLEEARAIGTTGTTVEGTDAVFPKLTISITKLPPLLARQNLGPYIQGLAGLVGCCNFSQYFLTGWCIGIFTSIQADTGELMFMGAEPTSDGRFKYDFHAAPNRFDIPVKTDTEGGTPSITVALKLGHEYQWMMYKQRELTKPPVNVPYPVAAFVAQIAPWQDFYSYLGF